MAVLKTLSSVAPCYLRYKILQEGSTDSNGNPVESGEHWSEEIPCDAVVAGKANERTFEDGERRAYSYTIYLRADCPDFLLGQSIELRKRDENDSKVGASPNGLAQPTEAEFGNMSKANVENDSRQYQVLGFARYQLQAKIWV